MKENFFTKNINKIKLAVAGTLVAGSSLKAQEAPKQVENLTDNKKIEASAVASNEVASNAFDTTDSFAKVSKENKKTDDIKFANAEEAKAWVDKLYDESEAKIKKAQEGKKPLTKTPADDRHSINAKF